VPLRGTHVSAAADPHNKQEVESLCLKVRKSS
jgi:hypothetical protein